MQFIRLGDRVLNLSQVAEIVFMPQAPRYALTVAKRNENETVPGLCLRFGISTRCCDDTVWLFGNEAVFVWAYVREAAYAPRL